MAEVNISIAGRSYDVFCEDGEEAELARLAKIVDAKAHQAQDLVGGVNEVRTLLFAALFLADDVSTAKNAVSAAHAPDPPAPLSTTHTAPDAINPAELAPIGQALDKLALRLESLAAGFEKL